MVKSIFVPSATATAHTLADPAKKMSGSGEGPTPAKAEGGESTDSETKSAAVDFHGVFAELQRFQQEGKGGLSIPVSHPALSRIIDSLSESSGGIETLSKRRWFDQMKELEKFKEKNGNTDVPLSRPLGNWVRIQRDQYKLWLQGISNSLTKKRVGQLKAIGFIDERVSGEKSDETDENSTVKLEENGGNKKTVKPGEGHSGEVTTDKKNEKSSQNSTVNQEGNTDNKKTAPEESHSGEVNNTAKIKGKCDICEKTDGFWGHNLQKCKVCNLRVHELCYGIVETKCKDPNFVCHACKAVSTEVEVNVPSKIGGCGKKMGEKRELVKQEHRPTECVLCSHDKGIHAMHPLLDTHGPDSRQLLIDRPCWGGDGLAKKEKRLAWVHTLCASVICSNPGTAGSVFGCDKDGNYNGDEEEDSCDEEEYVEEDNGDAKEDDNEAKSEHDIEKEDGSIGEESCAEQSRLCSFAIATEGGWAENIRDHRNLKCFICGEKDKTWRIPVQCVAGDKQEHQRWKDRHPRGTECCKAVHVGCARWGCVEPEGSHLETIDGKRCRLCYFTPGRYPEDDEASKDSYEVEKSKTVAHCYCTAHARDLVLNNPKKKIPCTVGGGSPAGKAKTKQPHRGAAREANRYSRARPRKKSVDRAQSSKKSMNTIRQRGGKKNRSQKRKSDTVDSTSKKPKIGFKEETAVQFPVRGRSASALAGMSGVQAGQSSGPMNPGRASPTPNPSVNNGQPAGILKKKAPTDSNGPSEQLSGGKKPSPVPDLPVSFAMGRASPTPNPSVNNGQPAGILKKKAPTDSNGPSEQLSGKRKHSPVPDLPVSFATGILKKRENKEPGVSNGPSEQVTGKRKAGQEPDLPVSDSFKRVKTETE